MKGLFYLLAFLAFFSVSAQPQLEFKRLEAEYPKERAVIIRDQVDVFIQMKNGIPEVRQENYTETMYLDNMAGVFSEHSVDQSQLDKITSISASTFVPGKKSYSEIKVKNFSYQDKISKSVFYDGSQMVSFLYPSLSQGSKSILKYSRTFTEPRLMHPYYFQKRFPVKEARFSVTVSNDIEIDWKIFNDKNNTIEFSKVPGKNKTTYTWKYNKVSLYSGDKDAPSFKYFIPHIDVWIKSYTWNGKKQSMMGTQKDLHDWYYDITHNVNSEASPEIRHVVDSLLAGVTDELEKVRKVFYWVQDNIKYVAFEDGMGGFIPRDAETVCHRRFGDCKDMANIIRTMLDYANVKSYLTWIGSRRIPYGYSDIATPIVDDHMICTYINGDDYYFLDATGQYMPLGRPTGFIQDKEAMISKGKGDFIIKKVPVPEYSSNRVLDSVSLHISGDKLMGRGKTIFTGYEKIDMAHALSSGESVRQKVLREFYNKGNNKFLISSFDLTDLSDRDKPLKVQYEFNIADYLKKHNDEVYVNLHLNKDLQKESINAERKLPVEKEHHNEIIYIVSLDIPADYSVTFLPGQKEFKDDRFGFSINYRTEGKKVIMTEVSYNKMLLLEKEDFEQWNNMIKELKKAYNEVLIIKKNK